MPYDELHLQDSRARIEDALATIPWLALAYHFGSTARGQGRPESDFDLAVLTDGSAPTDPNQRIRTVLDRLAGLVPADRVDLVFLDDAPPMLRFEVARTGVLLVARSPNVRLRFVTAAIRDFQDMEVRRNFFFRERRERLREGRDDGGSRDLLAQARGAQRLLDEAPAVPRDD